MTQTGKTQEVGVRYMICYWATNRTDPQNLLSTTLDVPLYYAPFLQQSVQLQIVLFIRSLCSLLTMVCMTMSNVVHQVALFPSFTSSLHYCVLGHSAFFLHWQFTLLCIRSLYSFSTTVRPQSAYLAHCLFQFYSNLFEFI